MIPSGKYSHASIIFLLIANTILLFILSILCFNTLNCSGKPPEYRDLSLWICLLMSIMMVVDLYSEHKRYQNLNESKNPESTKRSAHLERSSSGLIFIVAIIIATIQILYPGGPTQGWQFSVAFALTSGILFVCSQRRHRNTPEEKEEHGNDELPK